MKKIVLGLSALLIAASASAASLPTLTGPNGTNPPVDYPPGLGTLNQIIGTINSGITPASMASVSPLRNYLDNGEMMIQQRGTGIQTCGTTAIASANYSADRWGCNANVTSGAGRAQVTTTTPAPPPTLSASLALYRTSGALTQPVCTVQEIPSSEMVDLQGASVVFSTYIQALSSAAGANAVSATVVYGTGTDQGLGTFTASPAVTPAWTGIASLPALTLASTTTGWVRYQSAPITVPTAATEGGVIICYTPSATGAGTTDGIAISGAQLELSATVASAFESRPFWLELFHDQRYYYQLADGAGSVRYGMCQATTTAIAICELVLPATMRVVPTITVATATSFGVTVAAGTAGTCTTLAAIASSGTLNEATLSCTTGSTLAAGNAALFIGAGTGAVVSASADF